MNFSPVILIPVYNHGKACFEVVKSLIPYCSTNNVKILLIDDGNKEETKLFLQQAKNTFSDYLDLVVLEKNSGKGGAFKAGIIYAYNNGFTHALQMDADGQHDYKRVEFFINKSKENPNYMICGFPEYDDSVPSHRKNGRKFANNWCKIVTWNKNIVDSMCGFRLYPIKETYDFLTKSFFDKRMGFDIDILVRLIWKNIPFKFYSVKVTYPKDGISNFNVVRDNIRISWVFTKLCCGMFIRIPKLLFYKIKQKS